MRSPGDFSGADDYAGFEGYILVDGSFFFAANTKSDFDAANNSDTEASSFYLANNESGLYAMNDLEPKFERGKTSKRTAVQYFPVAPRAPG